MIEYRNLQNKWRGITEIEASSVTQLSFSLLWGVVVCHIIYSPRMGKPALPPNSNEKLLHCDVPKFPIQNSPCSDVPDLVCPSLPPQLCVVMIFLVTVVMCRGIVSVMMFHTGSPVLRTEVCQSRIEHEFTTLHDIIVSCFDHYMRAPAPCSLSACLSIICVCDFILRQGP